MIFEGAVDTEEIIHNFPEGREVQVHTDADITVAFWYPVTKNWGPEIEITAPGNWLGVGSYRGRISGSANIRILDTLH